MIPNLEIRKIFIEQIMEWLQEEAKKDRDILPEKGMQDSFEKMLSALEENDMIIPMTGAPLRRGFRNT